LLFNEADTELPVMVKTTVSWPASVFEKGEWVDAWKINVMIPPRDAAVIHVR
jgi:hypothetical protein